MDEIDLNLDLESAELKTVDLSPSPSNKVIDNNSINISSSHNNFGNSFSVNKTGHSRNISVPNLSVYDTKSGSTGLENDFDMGLSLLANKKKQRSESPSSSFANTNNSSYNNENTYSAPETVNADEILKDSLFESNLENIELDNELNNQSSFNDNGMSGPSFPSMDSPSALNNNTGNGAAQSFDFQPSKAMSYEDIQKAKFDLLCKFERLRDKGVRIPKTFSMSSDYEEMKYEYDRLVHQRKMDNSVKMQRQMLISFVTGVEFLNGKFDPFDLKLDNWSEHVHENINDYDDIFEELYDKYQDSASMAPELKLMFMLGGSAFMYHLSNTMFKSALPGVGDIMKQNPDLMKQFTQAAMNTVGQQNPGFAGFMGNVMNPGSGSGPSMAQQNEVPPYNPMNAPPFANPSGAPPPSPSSSTQRVEMTPPTDFDTLLANISGSKDISATEKEISLDL